jgi:hypothetical protein
MPSLQKICEPRTPATGVPGVTVIANPCCSTTLGVRASCPHRVSEGRMPSLQETCEHVLRCCVSTRQYAIMRRLNECEARHRNGI